MWTCSKCKEPIEDEFDSCWKCAGRAIEDDQRTLKPRSSDQVLVAVQSAVVRWPKICTCCGVKDPTDFLERRREITERYGGAPVAQNFTYSSRIEIPVCSKCKKHSEGETWYSVALFVSTTSFLAALVAGTFVWQVFGAVQAVFVIAILAVLGGGFAKLAASELRKARSMMTPTCASALEHVKYTSWIAEHYAGQYKPETGVHKFRFFNTARGWPIAEAFVAANRDTILKIDYGTFAESEDDN